MEDLWNGVTLNTGTGPPLGTDSVVLADFALPCMGGRVCDLGCGSGAVALMLLADDPRVSVTGLELQPDFAALAEENAAANHLTTRFSVVQGDLRQVRELLPMGGFSCVVSNPPYFPADSLPPKDPALALARTEKACTPEDLCAAAAWLLPTGGRFCLVHRPERLTDLLCALRSHGLEPKKLRFVRHSAAGKRSLLLLDAVRNGKPGIACEDDLILYNSDGSPTEDCRRIYHW